MEAGERVVGVNGSADERQYAGELLQVRGVFKSFGGTMPALTQHTIDASNVIRHQWYLVILGVTLVVLLSRRRKRRPTR